MVLAETQQLIEVIYYTEIIYELPSAIKCTVLETYNHRASETSRPLALDPC
jgi:hypothetical protein